MLLVLEADLVIYLIAKIVDFEAIRGTFEKRSRATVRKSNESGRRVVVAQKTCLQHEETNSNSFLILMKSILLPFALELMASFTFAQEHPREPLWKKLQKAETMLVQTGRTLHRAEAAKVFEGIDLERPQLVLLIRMSFGLSVNGFRVEDYHTRYPYTTEALIRERVEELVEASYVEKGNQADQYKTNPKARELINHYLQSYGGFIRDLDYGPTDQSEQQAILALDQRILNSLQSNTSAETHPIFYNRLAGTHPDYSEPQLWHHWHLVWTMLAALKDEE